MKIEIVHDQHELDPKDIIAKLDNRLVRNPVFWPGTVILNTEAEPGIHMLALTSNTGTAIEIKDVKIDGVSLRHCIYLSYVVDEGKIIQPATCLYKKKLTWYLPFGNPISHWVSTVLKKFGNGALGTDLHSKYHISYPVPMTIDDRYPKIIRDFFAYDFDFAAVADESNAPFLKIKIDESLAPKILARVEILKESGDIDHTTIYGANDQHNFIDDPDWKPGTWKFWDMYREGKWIIERDIFPEVFEFLETNGIEDFGGVTVGFVTSRGYIYPHIDPRYEGRFDGPCQFYVPLNFLPGNWIKLAGVGTFDTSAGQYAFNVCNYPHAAVNDTEQDRCVLIIRCNVPEHLKVRG